VAAEGAHPEASDLPEGWGEGGATSILPWGEGEAEGEVGAACVLPWAEEEVGGHGLDLWLRSEERQVACVKLSR
jgi:hypothetical protein